MANLAPLTTPDLSFQAQRITEFFLARQPILNRNQELFAYELLFRSAATGPANVTDDMMATASVIAHAAELGMANVIGASLGFINVDAAMLMSDVIHFLPKQKVVLEILETVEVTDRLVARIEQLIQAGYAFALDDVVAASERVHRLLPLVDIVKVDIGSMALAGISALVAQFRHCRKELLAEKVESQEQYQHCLALGFEYFQGYYFARPTVLTGKKLSPSQLVIMELMAHFATDADMADVEQVIKRDASLSLTLLRLANRSVISTARQIDSLGQALAALGRHQVQRWLQILLYAEAGTASGMATPLLMLATTRGRLLELMAERLRPGDSGMADTAFAVGIMSLLDALLDLPMSKVLQQIPVATEVRDALLLRRGLYGDMLRLVELIEYAEEDTASITALLHKLRLPTETFRELQLAAFAWSDMVSLNAG